MEMFYHQRPTNKVIMYDKHEREHVHITPFWNVMSEENLSNFGTERTLMKKLTLCSTNCTFVWLIRIYFGLYHQTKFFKTFLTITKRVFTDINVNKLICLGGQLLICKWPTTIFGGQPLYKSTPMNS